MINDIVARRTDLESGRWVEIIRDNVGENPMRDWDWEGQLVLIPRYSWAGTDASNDPSDDDFRERLRSIRICGGVVLPVYAYDHSGVRFSTSNGYPFCDPFDGRMAGYAYVTRESILKNYGGDSVLAVEYLKAMVHYADAYSNGECYGYVAYGPDGNELDSCYGFWHTSEKTWREFMEDIAEDVSDDFAKLIRDCDYGTLDPLEVIPARYYVPGFAPVV